MSRLDINTPRGQETLQQEARAVEIFVERFPSLKYVETPKDREATIDAVIINGNKLYAVVETKCRNLSFKRLSEEFNCRWLVTAAKIDECTTIAKALMVPVLGFLYLVPDDLLLIQKIWTPDDGWVVAIGRRVTETQATVNGGAANRENAFIDMSGATVL